MVHRLFKIYQKLKWIEPGAQRAFYSRKSSSNVKGTYKIVTRSPVAKEDGCKSQLATNSNWELLAPQGFRFYLPGGIGPAWHDEISVSFIPTTIPEFNGAELECDIQECPVLLRQGIVDLFDLNASTLTVVSLTQKKNKMTTDQEIERLTKQFLWAALDISKKLKKAGYWADFINPFSGVPYGNPFAAGSTSFPQPLAAPAAATTPTTTTSTKIYDRFQCLDFQITEKNSCRIISNKAPNKFTGSLFTDAPASAGLLKVLLQDFE